jgi:RNA recognition motif-containing protein
METKVFVGNLSRSTTEEDLSTLFAQAGTVEAVEVIVLQKPANPMCFAFVEMSSPRDAEKAVRLLNGSDLNGRPLRVNIARPREPRPAGGGWYKDSPPAGERRKGPTRRKSV